MLTTKNKPNQWIRANIIDTLYEPEYRERLQALLEEIFNHDIPFCQTEEDDKCTYCDYCKLCRK